MDAGHDRTHLRAENGIQRSLAAKDCGYLKAQLPQRSRNLRTDETHAHHHGPAASRRNALDRLALGHSPELIDALKIGAGRGQRLVAPSSRDQQLSVIEDSARLQCHLLPGSVNAHDPGLDPLDLVLLVPVVRFDQPARQVFLPTQVCLRKRWPPERHAWLLAYQRQPTAPSILSQGLRGTTARDAGTDDDHRTFGAEVQSWLRGVRASPRATGMSSVRVSTVNKAPASASSTAVAEPLTTPIAGMPAAAAACMSQIESPT